MNKIHPQQLMQGSISMSQEKFNTSLNVSEISEESNLHLYVSEEAEILKPRGGPQGQRDISCRTCHEQKAKIQSEVETLELELKELRAKRSRYTKQEEELSKLHGQQKELNSKIEIMIQDVSELEAENNRLVESVCKMTEIKGELERVSNLLSEEKSVREKNEAYIRELEEKNLLVSQEEKNMTAELICLESLTDTLRTDNEHLWTEIHALKENEKRLNDQVAHLEVLRETCGEEAESLREALQDLEIQVQYVEEQIWSKDELIRKQKMEMYNQRQMFEQYYIFVTDIKKTLLDRKHQLEMRQEEDILAGVENFREESLNFAENTEQQEIPEDPSDDGPWETPPEEPQQLETQAEEPQQLEILPEEPQQLETQAEEPQQLEILPEEPQQLETLAEEPQPLEILPGEPQQLETQAVEPQQLETPAEEPKWRRFGKRLLKVGLGIGIASVGIIIPSAILVSMIVNKSRVP